jgi:hypothetical protein
MISKARALSLASALAISFAIALPPVVAAAQQPTKAQQAEAGTRFKKGVDLFKEGDYQAALIEFRRAHDLAPNFNVLYNIGQVYFQLQDYPNALTSLQKYLSEGGSKIPSSRKQEVERDIEKLKSRVANVDVTTNVEGAEITIDDVNVGRSPLGKPVLVGAGRHRVVASKTGYVSASKTIEVASGDTPRVSLELAEEKGQTTATPPPPPPSSTGDTTPPPPPPATGTGGAPPPPPPASVPWVGWAITGGLAAGAAVTGILALGASSDLKTLRDQPTATRDELDKKSTKVVALSVTSDICTGAAVLAGGISLYLTLSGSSSPPKADAQTKRDVKVGVTPGGVTVFGRF